MVGTSDLLGPIQEGESCTRLQSAVLKRCHSSLQNCDFEKTKIVLGGCDYNNIDNINNVHINNYLMRECNKCSNYNNVYECINNRGICRWT
jgi:hypothetical protein